MSACTGERGRMSDRVTAIEQALKQIANAKHQLCRNTAEAKSRVQCNISRQLETLRNREVWLLHQLDLVSSAKEEVLQQQSARLYKSLGIVQSTSHASDSSRLDLGDLQPEETPFVSFQSDTGALREAIMNYGKIDSSSVQQMQSPFMRPGQQAPSLPRQFEDYNDAEHHILYKTVEEVKRSKSDEPCVYVNIPKLSCRVEDWLLKPAEKTSTVMPSVGGSTFSYKVSNNLSDWLKSPLSTVTSGSFQQGTLPVTGGMSADASVKTWLHKIKQNPLEEEEDDYEFIDEVSDTRTQVSDALEQFPQLEEEEDAVNIWLTKGHAGHDIQPSFTLKTNTLQTDKWLLKPSASKTMEPLPSMVDMSRYFTKITDDADKWLASSSHTPSFTPTSSEPNLQELKTPRPPLPMSLDLPWTLAGHVSRKDNPWLLRSSVRSRSGESASPLSSRRSSISSVTSCRTAPLTNKWLLQPETPRRDRSSSYTCTFMDKYKQDMDAVCWLKTDNGLGMKNCEGNPMSQFFLKCDSTVWIKPSKCEAEVSDEDISPLKTFEDKCKSTSTSDWLLKSHDQCSSSPVTVFQPFVKGDNGWLFHSMSAFDVIDGGIDETDL